MKHGISIFFLTLLSAAAALAAEPSVSLKYPENGNWYVQVFKVDSEGYLDSLEKRAYATEKQADERIRHLARTLGTIEKNSLPDSEPTHELRNPLAGEIWNAKETWSVEWENRFAEWTRANFDPKFFKRHKIKTDCADATVALRWIFARVMGLPAGNRLSWGGGLLTNRSVRAEWKDLPTAENWNEDRRFLAALEYMMVHTYTHSVNADSYPIEINGTWLKEGSYHLELRAGDGHTRVFTNISKDASTWPLEDMWSNVPRKVRKLVVEPFTVFAQPPLNFGGIVRHRWARLTDASAYLVPADQMPGYSLEQYLPDFYKHQTSDFSVEIAARLRDTLDPLVGMRAVLENLLRSVDERKSLVQDGFKVCAAADCSPGTANYEDWSTPSRDARLGQFFSQVSGYLATLRGDDLERARVLVGKVRKKTLLKFDGKNLSYDDLEKVWLEKSYSSDPRDPPARRWGLSALRE